MKRFLLITLLAFVSSQAVFAQGSDYYVKVKTENLRSAPNGDKMGELMSGTKLQVLEKNGNWLKVQLTGWMWDKSLTTDPTSVLGFKMRASHILFENEQTANQILLQLKQGADFTKMAQEHSLDQASGALGGDLGEFSRGDLQPAFEDAVLKLKVNEMVVIKTELGYHLIKRTK